MKKYADDGTLTHEVLSALDKICNSAYKTLETHNLTEVSGNEERFLIALFQINVNLFKELLIKDHDDLDAFIDSYKQFISRNGINYLETCIHDLCDEIQKFLKDVDKESEKYSIFYDILTELQQLTGNNLKEGVLYESDILDIFDHCYEMAEGFKKFYLTKKILNINLDLKSALSVLAGVAIDIEIELGQENFHVYRRFHEEIKYPYEMEKNVPTIKSLIYKIIDEPRFMSSSEDLILFWSHLKSIVPKRNGKKVLQTTFANEYSEMIERIVIIKIIRKFIVTPRGKFIYDFFWATISGILAQRARGSVFFLFGDADPVTGNEYGKIWTYAEFPSLIENKNVHSIVFIDGMKWMIKEILVRNEQINDRSEETEYEGWKKYSFAAPNGEDLFQYSKLAVDFKDFTHLWSEIKGQNTAIASLPENTTLYRRGTDVPALFFVFRCTNVSDLQRHEPHDSIKIIPLSFITESSELIFEDTERKKLYKNVFYIPPRLRKNPALFRALFVECLFERCLDCSIIFYKISFKKITEIMNKIETEIETGIGKEESDMPDDDVIIDKGIEDLVEFNQIIGTSTALEKSYCCLIGNPKPEYVRPPSVLRQSLEFCLNKFAQSRDYQYISDQLRSIRQDMIIQRIEDEFAVHVYETSINLAVENFDWENFNQCLDPLEALYANGLGNIDVIAEIESLKIIYLASIQKSLDLYQEIPKIAEIVGSSVPVNFAIRVCQAIIEGDLHALLKLYKEAPPMQNSVLSILLSVMRHKVLSATKEAFRNLKLEDLTEILCFVYPKSFIHNSDDDGNQDDDYDIVQEIIEIWYESNINSNIDARHDQNATKEDERNREENSILDRSDKKEMSSAIQKGLKNYSLTCYCNSAIQVIIQNESIRNLIYSNPTTHVEELLADLIDKMISTSETYCEPNPILQYFNVEKNVQGDANLFYINLIQSLSDTIKSKFTIFGYYEVHNEDGSFSHNTGCNELELFVNSETPLSLQDQINKYYSGIQSDDNRTTKLVALTNPEFLNINILRFISDSTGIRKSQNVLKIDESITNNSETYELFALICHYGSSPTHGHYRAFVKHLSTYWCYDDQKVTKCDLPDVLEEASTNAAVAVYSLKNIDQK